MNNSKIPVIALDSMGGDRGLSVNVEGAVESVNKFNVKVILVGNIQQIQDELKKYKIKNSENISIHNASEIITMDDVPTSAVRQKRDSSIVVGIKLVAEKKADAFVSAGNSGAIMTAALMCMRRLPDIIRPAITTVLPTLKGWCVILDVGANVDCKPKNLLQFAVMGSEYVKEIYGISNPRIGLLSIGKEKTKGNELTLQTYELLEKSGLNFIGNIEGNDIPKGNVDVVVCDGFIGNIILKFGEGVAEMLFNLIKLELKKHPLAFAAIPFLWGALKDLIKRVDYSEYGGAPLLGIDGTCIICHGISNSKAICNAIRVAADFVKKNINEKISKEIKKYTESEN
ncbi:MAG: phosphate acyltransferase PlsX [Endomicrobiia bacterium]